MGKAIIAAFVTLIAGYVGMVIGAELMHGFVDLGIILAVAVMGAFIIYFNEKKK